jgi:hypothetical protein
MLAQQQPVAVRCPEHSRHGVASFVYALFVLGLNAVLFAVLGVLYLNAHSAGPVLAFAGKIGGINFLAWLGSFVALIQGVIGLVKPGGKKALAAWGVALNGLFFFGILLALVVSLSR